MSVQLPDGAKALLDAATFVTFSTLRGDGSPQSTVVWAKRDGDDILVSTIVGRAKERNLRRDPRAGVVFWDPATPYSYYSINGSTSMTTDGGPELIDELSWKYDGETYTGDLGTDHVRVVVRLTPEWVFER